MGKHGKPAQCSVCKGQGGWQMSEDGRNYWLECWACSGTGQQ